MKNLTVSRVFLYGFLILAAVYTLIPLYVMLSTSFKSMDEIRDGSLLALPHVPTIEAWAKAWSSACTGTASSRTRPLSPT